MRWPIVALKSVSVIITKGTTPTTLGCSYSDSGIPFLRAENLQNGTIEFRLGTLFIDETTNQLLARSMIKNGDVLISIAGTIGRVGVVSDDAPLMNCNQAVAIVRLTASLLPRFLMYWLTSWEAKSQMAGAKVTQTISNLSLTQIGNLEVPVPPLSEQHRIVEILDEADRLRRLRREADAKAARILPALFLKMFGDPATNPKGWPVSRVRDLAIKYSDGPFGSNLKSDHYVPDGVRVIRLQNIGVGQLIDTDKAFISFEHFSSVSKHECLPGDVLIGTLGDPNLRACIQPDEIALALNKADCVQLRVNPDKATKEFACWLINMPGTLSLAQSLVLGQTRSRISMGRLGELLVPVPPLELQQDFSRKVQVVNSVLAKTDSVCGKVENLFNSLMQRAFSGQLTVKWREAHSKELLAEMEQQARLLNLPLPKELETTP